MYIMYGRWVIKGNVNQFAVVGVSYEGLDTDLFKWFWMSASAHKIGTTPFRQHSEELDLAPLSLLEVIPLIQVVSRLSSKILT